MAQLEQELAEARSGSPAGKTAETAPRWTTPMLTDREAVQQRDVRWGLGFGLVDGRG